MTGGALQDRVHRGQLVEIATRQEWRALSQRLTDRSVIEGDDVLQRWLCRSEERRAVE